MLKNKQIKVGVIVGGTPEERREAVQVGDAVNKSLVKCGYTSLIINLDKNIIEKLLKNKINFAFIVDANFTDSRNEYSPELGNSDLRKILDDLEIPYNSSDREAAARTKDKIASKNAFIKFGLHTPNYTVYNQWIPLVKEVKRITSILDFPLIVKPRGEGSSAGVTLVKNSSELIAAIKELKNKYSDIFIEKFIKGVELTIPILEMDGIPVPLVVIEVDPSGDFYNYKIKDEGMMQNNIYHIPARINEKFYQYAQQIAVIAHKSVGCRHYSRVDMIIDSSGKVQVIEINSLPALTTWPVRMPWLNFDWLIKQIMVNSMRDTKYEKFT